MLQIVVVGVLGLWTVVYMLWECLEEVTDSVWKDAEQVIYREVYKSYAETRILQRLHAWHWTPMQGGRRLREVFTELMSQLWLSDDERTEFEELCVDTLRIHHRWVPVGYLRRCVREMLPTYVIQQDTVARLWNALQTNYNGAG